MSKCAASPTTETRIRSLTRSSIVSWMSPEIVSAYVVHFEEVEFSRQDKTSKSATNPSSRKVFLELISLADIVANE